MFTKVPAVGHETIGCSILTAVEGSASFAHPQFFIATMLS